MIMKAVVIALIIHFVFAVGGHYILDYFGIGMGAIKIGGGVLLFLIGLEMVYGRTTRTEINEKEEEVAIELDDVSVTPLAIPLLAGPGSITTVLIFSGMSSSVPHYLVLLLGIMLV
jgi:multiple antibiotic resistance protein